MTRKKFQSLQGKIVKEVNTLMLVPMEKIAPLLKSKLFLVLKRI
jgi:hypothetical protein